MDFMRNMIRQMVFDSLCEFLMFISENESQFKEYLNMLDVEVESEDSKC